MAQEVVEEYTASLADLTFNSKPLINMLTMLAEDNAQYSEQIVQVIEAHMQKVLFCFIHILAVIEFKKTGLSMYYGITLLFIQSSRGDWLFAFVAFGTPFLNQLHVAWQYPKSGLIAFSKPMYQLS